MGAELYINLICKAWPALVKDGQLRDQLRDQLGGQLGGQLGDQLWGQLGGQLGGQKLSYMGTWFCGNQGA